MNLPERYVLEVANGIAGLDARLAEVPDAPAVFLVHASEGKPYLARTGVLRRRLRRLLKAGGQLGRALNLRSVATRVEYWPAGSPLEGLLVFYELARRNFPQDYLAHVKLRMPAYVKLVLSNQFPRSLVTSRLTGGHALFHGPFRSRAAAEAFESQVLDFFQMRRCQEDLTPSPDHPGCIYGEMGMCLRPCQAAVGPAEYFSEIQRVREFLSTGGRSLALSVAAARDRFSQDMDFEEAARQHKRLEKIQQAFRISDELARDIDRLHGVAVTRSSAPGCVELWFFVQGWWQTPVRLSFEVVEGKTVSIDHRLREAAARLEPRRSTISERQEHLALLARWYYSSWREGHWLGFEAIDRIPYRRLVRAVSRVARDPG